MNKSYITFNISTTTDSKSLGVQVLLDDHDHYNNNFFSGKELIKVELPNDESEHSLKIILKNKTAEHTVLDSLGSIVQDTNLVIEDIKFDEIDIGYNALQQATYTHDCNGTDQLKEHKFYKEIGCNGTVELKFSTPIYVWLLEYM